MANKPDSAVGGGPSIPKGHAVNPSPYTTRAIRVLVGPNHTEYTVLEAIIDKHRGLKEKLTGQGSRAMIDLRDVDDDSGHTLIHYLFTGEYQVWGLDSIPNEERAKMEFKTSVLAYCAARLCGVSELEELTKNKIEEFGTTMSIFDLHATAEEVSPKLPRDTDWFYARLDRWIKSTIQADNNLLSDSNLFSIVRTPFDKALLKAVAELYAELKAGQTGRGDAHVDQAVTLPASDAKNGELPTASAKPTEPERSEQELHQAKGRPSGASNGAGVGTIHTDVNGPNAPWPAADESSSMLSEEPCEPTADQPPNATEGNGRPLQGSNTAQSVDPKPSKKSKKKKKRADSLVVQPLQDVEAE